MSIDLDNLLKLARAAADVAHHDPEYEDWQAAMSPDVCIALVEEINRLRLQVSMQDIAERSRKIRENLNL